MRLSHRYIPARQLPDKAVSLLDTACARVAVSQHATPPEVEDCRRRIEALRDGARHHRARGGRSASTSARARAERVDTAIDEEQTRAGRAASSAGRRRRSWSIASSSSARSCAPGPSRRTACRADAPMSSAAPRPSATTCSPSCATLQVAAAPSCRARRR